MRRFLKIHHLLFTLTFLLLEACGPGNAVPTSQVPSGQSTIPVTSGVNLLPSPTFSPTLSSTPTTTPSQTPTQTLSPTSTSLPPTPVPAASLEPIAKGADIRIDSWAPDGLWLGLWLWTPNDKAAGLAPPGKLIFLNPQTDEICEYADFVFSEYYPQVFWQPDGRAAVYHTDSYWIGFPCQDFVPIQAEDIEIPAPSDETQSPEGTFRAETNIQDSQGGWLKLRTTIKNNITGEEENWVNWEIDDRLGSSDEFLGGKWVTDDLFLIYETRNKGPLLIQAGGEIVQVAPDLFDVPATQIPQDADNWFNLRAFATSVDNEDLYHILLYGGSGSEALFPPVRLFHSDTGEVETLPYTHLWHLGFTPDGRWVLLDSHPDVGGYESNALWIRPVDPPSSQMSLFAEGTSWSALSPTQSEIAFGWTGKFTVFRFPNGESVNTWTTGKYSNYQLIWSPTGDFLATSGNIPGEYGAGIFVVDIREWTGDD